MELGDRPTLALLDSNGLPLVSLVAGESPFLAVCKRSCENQVELGAFSKDVFGLALYVKDEGQVTRPQAFSVSLSGKASFVFFVSFVLTEKTCHRIIHVPTDQCVLSPQPWRRSGERIKRIRRINMGKQTSVLPGALRSSRSSAWPTHVRPAP